MLTGTINEKDRWTSEGIINISSHTCEAFKSHIHTVRKTGKRGGKASHKVNTSDRPESTALGVLTDIMSRIHPVKHLWCCFISAACVRLIIYFKHISTVYY